MAVQGRKALVKVTGSAVAFTTEATTRLTANTVYQITSATKRVWSPTATITVYKDAVSQSAALYTLDRLNGKITFLSDIGGSAVVTVSGDYLPLSTAAEAKEYSYEISKDVLDDTAFGDSYRTKVPGLMSVSGSISRWYSTDTYFSDAVQSDTPVVLEMWSDSSASFDCRLWAFISRDGTTAPLKGLVDESVSFIGTTDTDLRSISG